MTTRVGVKPVVVGVLRGTGLAALAALVGGAIAGLSEADVGDLAPYVPGVILLLRAAEAWVMDQRRGQPPQASVLGGSAVVEYAASPKAPTTTTVKRPSGPAGPPSVPRQRRRGGE